VQRRTIRKCEPIDLLKIDETLTKVLIGAGFVHPLRKLGWFCAVR
jgi:hypothetical protein